MFTELNFDWLLAGSGQHGTSLFVTPGLAYVSKYYQLSVGTQLPLTGSARSDAQIAVVGSIIISMDQLNPAFAGMPF